MLAPVPLKREHLIMYVHVALLIAALLLWPFPCLRISDYDRLYVLGVLLAISFVLQRKELTFSGMDLAWWSLIVVTWISVRNAMSPVHVWYGVMTTTYLYLCYKSFMGVVWNARTKRIFFDVLGVIWALSLVYLIYVLWDGFFDQRRHDVASDNKNLHVAGINLHVLNCYVVALTPFVLFRKEKVFQLICPLALALLLYLLYASGSVMAFLVACSLAAVYLLWRLHLKRKTLLAILVSITLLLILAFSLFAAQRGGSLRGTNTVFNEFYSQQDRLWMWERSWNMFEEAPMLGHGKNNWKIAHGRDGYAGCSRCVSRTYRFLHAHNAFFQALSETGVLGLLCYLMLGLGLVRPAISEFRQGNTLAIAATLSLVAFLAVSMIYGTVYNFKNNLSVLTFLMALNLAVIQGGSGVQSIHPRKKTLLLVVLLSMVVASLYTTYRFDQARKLQATASAQIKQRDYGEARKTIQSALMFGDRSILYRMLGSTYAPEKDWKKFNLFYQQATSYDPYDRRILAVIGNQYLRHKKYSLALKYTQMAIDLDPASLTAQKLLIRIRLAQKRYNKAMQLARTLRKKYASRTWRKNELRDIDKLIKQIRRARDANKPK